MRITLLVLVALATVKPAFAQVLNLDEAVRLGDAQSQRLVAQRHALAATAEQVGRAAELPDPKLRLGIDNLPVTGPQRYRYDQDFMTQRTIGLMQEFPSDAKRQARTSRAEALRALEQANLDAQRAALHRDIAAAWLDVHFAERGLAVLRRFAGQFRLQIEAAAAGLTRGQQTAAESLVLRQALEQANDRVIEQERTVGKARYQLAAWLPGEAARPLGAPPDTTRIAHSREHLVSELTQHPMLRVYDAREGLARTEVELARSSKNSDWSLQVGYQQREPSFTNMVSVMVQMDLPWQADRRQDRDIASKLSEAGQVTAQREDARRMHEAEVRGWLADFDTAQKRIDRYGSVLLPLARERVAAAEAAYRGGKGELVSVLEADRSVTEAEFGLVQSEADRARAWVSLTFVYPQGDKP